MRLINSPKPRWAAVIVQREIASLERLMKVLPSEYDGAWATFHLHREIMAQIEVLRTGRLRDNYQREDEADAALFAMQWLYESLEGLFGPSELRVNEGPTQEWKQFEHQLRERA
jgi:hypothetical protein